MKILLELLKKNELTGKTERSMRLSQIIMAVILASGLLLVSAFKAQLYTSFETTHQQAHYLLFHTILEMASVVVSFAVFSVAWYSYRQANNRRDLFIACVFLLVGVIDFAHTFSYHGMPDFVTENSVSKASTYWIFARLTAAVGLFSAAFIKPKETDRPETTQQLFMLVTIILALFILSVEIFWPQIIPAMYLAGKGQTALKVFLEYFVIGLSLAGVVAFERQRHTTRSVVILIQSALIAGAFSEVAFTLYSNAFDTFNLIGHVYKIVAYYLIMKALFVSSVRRPYEQLYNAHQNLQQMSNVNAKLYQEAEKSRSDLEHAFSMIGSALGTRGDTNEVLQKVLEFSCESLNAGGAFIALMNGRATLDVVAARHLPIQEIKIPIEGSLAGEVIKTRQPRWTTSHSNLSLYQPVIDKAHAQSVLSVPILQANRCVGVLEVLAEAPEAFGQKQADLLFAFSRQIGVALQNASLYEETQQAARIAQQRATELETIIEQMADGVAITDSSSHDIRLNRAARQLLNGSYSEEDPLTVVDQFSALDGSRIEADEFPLIKALKGETTIQQNMHFRSEPENQRTFSISAVPLRDPENETIMGSVAVFRDITQVRKAQEQLELVYERERRIAETLQRSFLPMQLPMSENYEIGHLYKAALIEAEVGGDFYDVIELPNGNLGVVMADVSGKGLNAAVYTAMGKYMLRAFASEEVSPSVMMKRLNTAIAHQMINDYFITLFYGVIDPKTEKLYYVSAGHEPGLLFSKDKVHQLDSTGPVLGLLPEMEYIEKELDLTSDDVLVLYTDGVTDARRGNDFLATEGLVKIVQPHLNQAANEICQTIYRSTLQYAEGVQRDDIALLTLKVK